MNDPLSDQAFEKWYDSKHSSGYFDTALSGWQACARIARENRWAAFSEKELVRLQKSTNRANVTPAPVSIVDRETFCLMDLSRVGYVISICEYDERGKVVLRPDFRGQRLNLYFRDLTDGVGIATEADIEKTCKFSAKWALAARKDPEKAPLVVHCAAGISRSTAIAMIPLIAYYESVHLAARRLYQIREFAQPNTHVLYLIHQTLSLEENIYEILFQAQNPGL